MKTDIDIGRLASAIQKARLVLRRPREERVDMVKQYVGSHWSEQAAQKQVPCNLIAQYVSIVGKKLIAHNPRLMLSTWSQAAKPVVGAMQRWSNKEIEKIMLVDTISEAVQDALFSIGIVKVALASPSDAALLGWRLKAGTPFAECIDLDDFVFDIHAKKLREAGYMGHRLRVPLATIRKRFKGARDMAAEPDKMYNLEGDERIGLLGRTTLGGDNEEYEDFVDLWEIYLPRHKVVVTLLDDDLTGAAGSVKGKALNIQRWLGPECGPYHILGFGSVPGNPMPKAPVQDLMDLHMAINAILRKLLTQAENQKSVGVVRGGADEDGNRIINADDMQFIKADNPQDVTIMQFNGPNQQNYQLFEAMKGLFSWLAGNLDVLGGLSPQGDTATQEKLLNSNSTAGITEMQQRTVDFTSSICGALTWFWHHHPTQVMRAEYEAPGMPGMTMAQHVHPQGQGHRGMARDHDYDDMDIKVDPYSMPHQTPQQRIAMLQQVVTSTFLPLAQLCQQQGVSLDMNAYFRKIGEYMDDPDLQEVLTTGEPAQQEPPSGGDTGPKPSQEKTYNRRSMGAVTPPSQGQKMSALSAAPSGNGKAMVTG